MIKLASPNRIAKIDTCPRGAEGVKGPKSKGLD